MPMHAYAQIDSSNIVKAVSESSAEIPNSPTIIALPAYDATLIGCLWQDGVFKRDGDIVLDPTP
jgi:hypothetical protein